MMRPAARHFGPLASHFVPLAAVALLAAAGCGSHASTATDASDGPAADRPDAAVEMPADLAPPPDLGSADAPADLAPADAATDVAADAPASDGQADAPRDAGPDAPADAPADGPQDAPVDAAPDAPLDAPADAPRPDANPADASPDGPAPAWPRIIPGAVISIAFSPSNQLVIAGQIAPSTDLGCPPPSPAGSTAMFVAAFSPADATCLWSARFGAANGTFGSMVVTPAGDVAVGGVFGSSPFDLGGGPLPQVLPNWQTPFVGLFSVGPAGLTHQWSTTFTMETVGQGIVGLTATPTLTVAGTYDHQFYVNGTSVTRCCTGYDQMFVVPLTATGAIKWARGARQTSGTDIETITGYDVAVTPTQVFVTGDTRTMTDFDSITISPAKNQDAFLAAYAADTGTIAWVKHWGSSTQGLPSSGLRVLAEPGGTVIVTGEVGDGADLGFGAIQSGSQENAFVARFDAQGNALAAASIPVDAGSIPDIVRRPDGSFVVAGSFRRALTIGGITLTPSDIRGDLFMARLSADLGTWSAAESFGSPGEAYSLPLAVAGDGTIAISVPFADSVDFRGVHYAAGGGNALVTVLPN